MTSGPSGPSTRPRVGIRSINGTRIIASNTSAAGPPLERARKYGDCRIMDIRGADFSLLMDVGHVDDDFFFLEEGSCIICRLYILLDPVSIIIYDARIIHPPIIKINFELLELTKDI